MALDYPKLAGIASRLIRENGRVCDIQILDNVGDAQNPKFIKIRTTVNAVNTRFTQSEIDGEVIRTDDKQFLVSVEFSNTYNALIEYIIKSTNNYTQPTTNMRFIDNGIDYEIKNITPIEPADTVILFKVQVRL